MSLFEAIDRSVQAAPEREAIVWVDEDGQHRALTAGELQRNALIHAAALRAAGVRPGELVLLALNYDRALLPLFLGASYAGAVPAILSYLSDRSDPIAYSERVGRMARLSSASAVICPSPLHKALADQLQGSSCRGIDSSTLDLTGGERELPAPAAADAIATIQFTSGTTGVQKGVRLSHRSLCEFIQSQIELLRPSSADTVVSWLPLYHDMGLITGVLFPLVAGIRTVLMSPAYWVRSPAVMLRAIHQYRGTLAWMPTFAYSLIGRNLRDADLAGLDLSCWRFSAIGAEVVRADAIEVFCRRLEPCGVRREIVRAGYGMAENVLTATLCHGSPRVDSIDVAQLQQHGRATPCASGTGAVEVVSNGPPIDSSEIAIVDQHGTRLAEREVGEILVRSRHLFSGYHLRPDLTEAALLDGWFRSGDLGYLADGELYICGRKKDLIIYGGNNIYPEDIEAIADRTEGVQPGRAVAFGVADAELGTERIVLVCELREGVPDTGRRQIDRSLRRQVLRELDVALALVHFSERGWILKTTSGKHARSANRDKYLAEVKL